MDVTSVVQEKLTKRKVQKNASKKRVSVPLMLDIKIELCMANENGIFVATAKVGRTSVGSVNVDFFTDPDWKKKQETSDEE